MNSIEHQRFGSVIASKAEALLWLRRSETRYV